MISNFFRPRDIIYIRYFHSPFKKINLYGATSQPGKWCKKHIPCLQEAFNALQNRTSGAITIYTDDFTAKENLNAPQLSPPQDLEAL